MHRRDFLRTTLVFFVALILLAPQAHAQNRNAEVASCGKRFAESVITMTENTLAVRASCVTGNLGRSKQADCATDDQTTRNLRSISDKAFQEVKKCKSGGASGLCAFGVKTSAAQHAVLTQGPDSLVSKLADVHASLWVDDHGPSCPRPAGRVSTPAAECAKRIAQAVSIVFAEHSKCVFKCETSNLEKSSEACVDPVSGLPVKKKVQQCVNAIASDFEEEIGTRCKDEHLIELGCPAQARSLADLASAVSVATTSVVAPLNLKIFRSPCRNVSLPPIPPPSGEPPTGKALLTPGGEERTIQCGHVLDRAFFGEASGLVLASDLNCDAVDRATDGLVVATSGVTIDLGRRFGIVGPGRSSLRTGTGIAIAPGVTDVVIKNGRRIQRFAVGIGDAGDNSGLSIRDVAVFRNVQAGLRLSSPGVKIENVVADRNAVGMELSGDGILVKGSSARRSTPAPGVGIYLQGGDTDGDDQVVRIESTALTANIIGMVIEGGPHLVRQNRIIDSQGDGIELAATGARVDSNALKRNKGHGLVLTGSENLVTNNRFEEGGKSGVAILGERNLVVGNRSGSLTDKGNAELGYLVTGSENSLSSNVAEANLGAGYAIHSATAVIENNRASRNAGAGFEILSPGNRLASNAAERNTGPEFVIDPGNVDGQGNRANGATFKFSADGVRID